tara:strand:- start:21547 stop:22602 length:1056 start_codon:yes stop_codon:yes gene_type:complete
MKNILVTGGTGFIGSHTCLVLIENGYKVFVIDSFENSSPKSIERVMKIYKNKNKNKNNEIIEIFEGSICDKKFLTNVFSDLEKANTRIDGVIHFAGYKAVAESINNPLLYWRNNLIGSINLLDVMSKFECDNLVFSSSATIYKTQKNLPLKESSDIHPINPYGNTKNSIEILMRDLFNSSNKKWKFASLRYFNPIGAHESGLIGEDPKGIPNNIFPLISNTALGIQKILKVYGGDWPTPDGTPIRDYIHVMDLAEAHLKVLEKIIYCDSICLNINVGTGKGTSVLDLIKTFESVNNIIVPYQFSNRREGDAAYIVADNTLLSSKYKLKPKRSLEDMCRDGWNWKKLNPKGF